MRMFARAVIFTIIFGINSCSVITNGIFGLKNIKAIDEKKILLYSNKYHIPEASLYQLDTTYLSFLNGLDTTRFKNQRYNHHQPLQALYYNTTGQLQSFHVNCYAGGIPNLRWDRYGRMQTFPPGQQAPVDSVLPLSKHLEYLRPFKITKEFSFENIDYFVIVYWSQHMGRQGRLLVQFVQKNLELSVDKKIKIFYVNTDNFWSATSSNKK